MPSVTGIRDSSNWFTAAGLVRWGASFALLSHAYEMLRAGEKADKHLILFAVLQTVECCMRFPYMFYKTEGRAGYIQTLIFILTFTVLCIMYCVPYMPFDSGRQDVSEDANGHDGHDDPRPVAVTDATPT